MGIATTIALLNKLKLTVGTAIISGFAITVNDDGTLYIGSGTYKIENIPYTYEGGNFTILQTDKLFYIDQDGVHVSDLLPVDRLTIKLCDLEILDVNGNTTINVQNVMTPVPNFPDNNNDNIADDANELSFQGQTLTFDKLINQTFFKDENTSDDMTEGATNLFFTEDRAKDSVGNTLVDTQTVNLTYNVDKTIQADVNFQDSTTIQLSEDANGLKADIINDSIDATQIKPNADLSSKNVKVQSTIDITDGTNTYNATDIANVIASINDKQNKITIDSVMPVGALDDLFIDISSIPYKFYRHDGANFNLIGGNSSGTGNGFDYEVNTDVNLLTLTPVLNETVFIRNYNSTGKPTIGYYDGASWVYIQSSVSTDTMLKSTYDTDNNGIVDKAEQLSDGTNTVTIVDIQNKSDKIEVQQNGTSFTTQVKKLNFTGSVTVIESTPDEITVQINGGSGTQEIYNSVDYASLPVTGDNNVIYVVKTDETKNNKTTSYIWDNVTTSYKAIESKPMSVDVDYNNAVSGLTATNVKDAIDELNADIQTNSSDIVNLQTDTGKVKFNATDTADYVDNKIDNITIQNVGNQFVAKSLDGLTSTITELNYLSGVTSNVQAQLNVVSGGGTNFQGEFANYATLLASIPNGTGANGYSAIVTADETKSGIRSYYIYSGTSNAWLFATSYDTVNDATTTGKGVIQLAGDLTGTANSPILKNSGVTAGSYNNANITVNAKGIVTSVSSGVTPPTINDNVTSTAGLWSSSKTNTEITTAKQTLGTKQIDETNIANDRVIKFNSTTNKLEYADANSLVDKEIVFLATQANLPPLGDATKVYVVKADSNFGNNPSMYIYDTSYKIVSGGGSGGSGGSSINNWISGTTYTGGVSFVIKDNYLYRSKITNSDVVFDPVKWDLIGADGSLYLEKSVYDVNGNGKVDYAENAEVANIANSVDWSNVQNKPTIGSITVTDEGIPIDTNLTEIDFTGTGVFVTQTASGKVQVAINPANSTPSTYGGITKLGVVGSTISPYTTRITLQDVNGYALPKVNVMKLIPGGQNVVEIKAEFDNTESANFITDSEVIFDGAMKLQTSNTNDMIDKGTLGQSRLFEVSLSTNNKLIEKLEVV